MCNPVMLPLARTEEGVVASTHVHGVGVANAVQLAHDGSWDATKGEADFELDQVGSQGLHLRDLKDTRNNNGRIDSQRALHGDLADAEAIAKLRHLTCIQGQNNQTQLLGF